MVVQDDKDESRKKRLWFKQMKHGDVVPIHTVIPLSLSLSSSFFCRCSSNPATLTLYIFTHYTLTPLLLSLFTGRAGQDPPPGRKHGFRPQ